MIECRPLDESTWPSLQKLFGKRGACGGCWCMLWRQTHSEYEKNKGARNKSDLRQLISASKPLGVIAFDNDIPIGWCSVSPRDSFPRLQRSKLFKNRKGNYKTLWSITCLFITKEHRRKGLSSTLIGHAAQFAFNNGADAVEAYPIIAKEKIADAFAWVGLFNSYKKVGFKKIAQPSPTRLLMRLNKS